MRRASIDFEAVRDLLPAPVRELVEVSARIAAAQAATSAERERLEASAPTGYLSRLLAGEDADVLSVAAEQRAHAEELATAKEAGAAAGAAWEHIEYQRIPAALAEHADEIILAMRPQVDALVEEARPMAAKLAAYAGEGYKGQDIAVGGSRGELEAYQASRPLQAELDGLRGVWERLVTAATQQPATRQLRPRLPAAGGEAAWERPGVADPAIAGSYFRTSQVTDDRLPGSTDLLAIAAQPAEAGYRLATIAELATIAAAREAELKREQRAERPRARAGAALEAGAALD